MTNLNNILARFVPFLLDPECSRAVDIQAEDSMGNGWLTLERKGLVWRISRDRSQVFLECRPLTGPSDSWYSLDILRRLISDERATTSLLTTETAGWLSMHIDEAEHVLSEDRQRETVAALRRLERLRGKELFGKPRRKPQSRSTKSGST